MVCPHPPAPSITSAASTDLGQTVQTDRNESSQSEQNPVGDGHARVRARTSLLFITVLKWRL